MSPHFDDPVAAYQRLGLHYAEVSSRRQAYLHSVERLILQRVPPGSRSLLDVGAGDGARAMRISTQASIKRMTLLEPADSMLARSQVATVEHWRIRAEDLRPELIAERFDVVTCLWNVLGHVTTLEKRMRALRGMAGLLSDRGVLFLDVNHRYNLRAYGVIATAGRWIHDLLVRSHNHGDAVARWTVDGQEISTYGHVFTHREVMGLARSASLEMQERVTVDYDSGKTRRLPWLGNLLYIFRRAFRMHSSSVPQTS